MGLLVRRLQEIRAFNRVLQASEYSYLLCSSRSYCSNFSNGLQHKPWGISSFIYKEQNALSWTQESKMTLRSTMAVDLSIFLNDKRLVTTQARPPPQARKMAGLKVTISSPGLVYEPYAPREQIPFWKSIKVGTEQDPEELKFDARWFTKSGWRRTKEEIILELKSAYAIAKLRKTGYSKQQFYLEAIELYKEINTLLANGDKTTIRKAVTEKMYSELKKEIKQRESRWNKIYWEMIEPVIKIRTLRARLIGVDRNDLNKAFVQLTLEIMTKQKFEAYDSKGNVVAGDKNKEVLVRDIWVFEKSLFHAGAFWRLCSRISV